MEEKLILTLIKNTNSENACYEPDERVCNWVVKDTREANRIIKKTYEELRERYPKCSVTMHRYRSNRFFSKLATVNKSAVQIIVWDDKETLNIGYEFYIMRPFDKKMTVEDNFFINFL